MKAFVLGNGESRAKLNLAKLQIYGTVIGCNGLYRDYRPDFLVTVDSLIAKEISASEYIKNWQVLTPYVDIANLHKNFVIFSQSKRRCAGSTGCLVAIKNNIKELYLVGHDLGTVNGLVNNMYKNTQCYKKAWEDDDSQNVYASDYLELFQKYPSVKFNRVMGKQTFAIKEFYQYKNYNEITKDEFCKMFQ